MSDFKIEFKNLEELQRALKQFPKQTSAHLWGAGREAATKIILPTQGLKKYPPATDANRPPVPFYVRGRGTETAHGNLGNSERLGTQFTVERVNQTNTKIGNRASYAPFVVGTDQAHFMAPKGWRKLGDVVEERWGDVLETYDKWVKKLLTKVKLR